MKYLLVTVLFFQIYSLQGYASSCESLFQSKSIVTSHLPTKTIEPLGMPKRSTVSKFIKVSFNHLLTVTHQEFTENGLSNPQNWRSLYKGFTQSNSELVTRISTSVSTFIDLYRLKSVSELQSEFGIKELEAQRLQQMIHFFEIDQPALIIFIEAYGKQLRQKNRVIDFDNGVNAMAAEGIAHLDASSIGTLVFLALGTFVIIPELSPSFQELSQEEQNFRSSLVFGVLSIGISIPVAIWSLAKAARVFVHTPFIKFGEARQRRLARNRVRKNIKETLNYLERLQTDLSKRTTSVDDLEKIIDDLKNLEDLNKIDQKTMLEKLYEFQLKIADYISVTLEEAPHPWLSSSDIVVRVLELARSSAASRKLSDTEKTTLANILSYLDNHKKLAQRLKSMVDSVSKIYERLQADREQTDPRETLLLTDQSQDLLRLDPGLENLKIISEQLASLSDLMETKEKTLEPLLIFDISERQD